MPFFAPPKPTALGQWVIKHRIQVFVSSLLLGALAILASGSLLYFPAEPWTLASVYTLLVGVGLFVWAWLIAPDTSSSI
jgi:hypothetical protein